MIPPLATRLRGEVMTGRIKRSKALGSSTQSASRVQKYGVRQMLMPTFSASGLPPFSLLTTSRRGNPGLK